MTLTLVDVGPVGGPAVSDRHVACASDEECPKDLPRCVTPGLCFACATDADCEIWERCTGGYCVNRVCEPGAATCVDDAHFVCQPGSDVWAGLPCAAGSCSKTDGCGACAPGQVACVGSDVMVCNVAGDSYVLAQACPAGEVCSHGTCVQCQQPGEVGCHQGAAVVCGQYGRWSVLEDCFGQGLQCTGGECTACESGTETCIQWVAHCKVDGKLTEVTDCGAMGLLCWQGACEPLCSDYDFKQGTTGNCPDGACCEYPDGALFSVGKDSCEPSGGELVPYALCQEAVCCRMPETLADVELPVGQCHALGGSPVVPQVCGVEVCCSTGAGAFSMLPVAKCLTLGGEADEALCQHGQCCWSAVDGAWWEAGLDDCLAAGGAPAADLLCEGDPTASTLTLGGLLEGSSACEPASRLAVPSSSANSVVVYDLETLTPLFPPVKVCQNPSRLILTPDGVVFTVCRGDGHMARIEPDGSLAWDVQLPDCFSARGIALHPDGRLFAGCSVPGLVYEIDPATGGLVADHELSTSSVYGMAVDVTGLYVAGGSTISRFDIDGGGPPAKAWEVDQYYYGITTDGEGTVWLGGVGVRALDAGDGHLKEAWGTDFVHGVTMGPDGLLYGAAPLIGSNGQGYHVLQPGVGIIATRLLGGSKYQHAPKGVALDGAGNAYTINLGSSTVTRVAPDGTLTSFGQTDLLNPYAYNGDLTGITTACVTGNFQSWESDPLVGPVADTLWLDVTWAGDVPEGSVLSVAYRLEPADSWTPLPQSPTWLGIYAPALYLRATVSGAAAEGEVLDLDVQVRHLP